LWEGGPDKTDRQAKSANRQGSLGGVNTAELDKRPQMPGEKAQNLQDAFLNHVRKQKVPVTIFLVNGVKLQGVITWFDNFCLLLRRDAQSQLVYKHAISTIMPGAPIQLFDPEHADD
jgi:host factor-I protein